MNTTSPTLHLFPAFPAFPQTVGKLSADNPTRQHFNLIYAIHLLLYHLKKQTDFTERQLALKNSVYLNIQVFCGQI